MNKNSQDPSAPPSLLAGRKSLSRKQREREQHRLEILKAAEKVFVLKGYHQATVEEIAQEAEFAVGTIYNFFKTKEELYICVTEKIAQDFMALFEEEVLAKSSPGDAIRSLIRLRLTHFEEHRGFLRVFLETRPGSRLDPVRALPPSLVGLYDRYIEAVSQVFKRGIEQGAFEDRRPLYMALELEGILNAFTAYWARNEPSEPLPVRVENLTRVFMR